MDSVYIKDGDIFTTGEQQRDFYEARIEWELCRFEQK